jgi:hypothetical protein
MADELRKKFGTSILSHFRPHFLTHMTEKSQRGQIVRLVDLFGLFIGDCLLDVSINCCKILYYRSTLGTDGDDDSGSDDGGDDVDDDNDYSGSDDSGSDDGGDDDDDGNTDGGNMVVVMMVMIMMIVVVMMVVMIVV